MHPLKRSLVNAILKCRQLKTFKQIHSLLVTSGIVHDDFIPTKAADFFSKHVDSVSYSCDFLFQISPNLTSLPFNSLISGYAGGKSPDTAILVYKRLLKDGFVPDMFTFPPLAKSCARILGISEGRQVHCVIMKRRFLDDIYVQNSLVHFYGVCGECDSARKVFDEMSVRDVVSWTGLMTGYMKVGVYSKTMELFLEMDVSPNAATIVTMTVACGRSRSLVFGKGIHGMVYKHALGQNLEVCNALIDMYVKCECLSDAKRVFSELDEKDIISWTSLINGLVQSKFSQEALVLFRDMQLSGLKPDKVILTSVLSACASLGALAYGRWIDEYISSSSMKWDIHVGTAMVDMYAKCGSVDMAVQTFKRMPTKNVYTWNAFLGGLAVHGHGLVVLKEFQRMIADGCRPNEVTFLAVLTACCHSGLVTEGRRFFHVMSSLQYNIIPQLEHYGCMVDLFCKAGLLDEAQELIRNMPMKPDVLVWGALLSGCRDTGNFNLSQDILDHLVNIEAQDTGMLVLLSNLYAANKRWDDVKRVRSLMMEKGLTKAPGSSVIEINCKAHEFLAGDSSHPSYEEILEVLKFVGNQIFMEKNS